MVEYDSRRDKIVVDGSPKSIGRAKQLMNGIESALATREAYLSCDALDEDCATNTRAIKLVCGEKPGSDDIPVTIGFAFAEDTETTAADAIPDQYVEAWVKQWETHGEVLVWESDVAAVFHETTAEFSGFHVEFADHEIRAEHL